MESGAALAEDIEQAPTADKEATSMALENKLGITSSADLAKAEERISKAKALDLFEKGLLDTFESGTFRGLAQIHQ